jgi:RNA polymerase sigma-70 factor (ECF subfamily)
LAGCNSGAIAHKLSPERQGKIPEPTTAEIRVAHRAALPKPPAKAVVVHGRFARKQTPDDRDGDQAVGRAIAAAKEGSNDALRYLYVRYADNVFGYARSLLRDEHDAEDVTQQVFTKLMSAIRKYEPRDVPFSAWILRVTHNVAIDHLRRQRLVPCGDVMASEDVPDDAGHRRAECLHEALASLPREQSEVLVMRHVLGMSPRDIADRLGKTEGSIHGLHHRGRATLKAALVALDAAPATVRC